MTYNVVTHELTIPECYKHFDNERLPPMGDAHRNAGEAMNWDLSSINIYLRSLMTCKHKERWVATIVVPRNGDLSWKQQSVPKVRRHFYWWLKYRAQVADVKQGAVLVPLWLQISRSITSLNEHKSFKTDSKIWDSKVNFPFITQHNLQRTIYFRFEDIIVTTRTRLFRIKLQM